MNQQLIGQEWLDILKEEFEQPYFLQLKEKLREEYQKFSVTPKPGDIFKAFLLTPPESIRCILIGADPYPNPNSLADGIAFSSQAKETPFSLQRIFREIDRDLIKTNNYQEFKQAFPNNDLTPWCKKGILLLNSCLTVRANEPGSHSELGWQRFITKVVSYLWEDNTPKVFISLGKEARLILQQAMTIEQEHKVIETGHPATGAHGKDLYSGSGMFYKTNHYFYKKGLKEIDWRLNENS